VRYFIAIFNVNLYVIHPNVVINNSLLLDTFRSKIKQNLEKLSSFEKLNSQSLSHLFSFSMILMCTTGTLYIFSTRMKNQGRYVRAIYVQVQKQQVNLYEFMCLNQK